MPGWFDEQLRQRQSADEASFSQAFEDLAEAVTGERTSGDTDGALAEIAAYFGVPAHAVRAVEGETNEDRLKGILSLLEANGVMWRDVELKDGWSEDAEGVYLTWKADGECVVLRREGNGIFSAPVYVDYASGQTKRINSRTEKEIGPSAICFYRPLSPEKHEVGELLKFAVQSMNINDVVYIMLMTLAVILAGMVSPYLVRILYTRGIHVKNLSALVPLFVFMVSAGISGALFTIAKMLALSRIEVKADIAVNSAVMMRVINLPAEFFRKYSSGELAQRVSGAGVLCTMGANIIFSIGLTAVMSLVYLLQIFSFSSALVISALMIVLTMTAITMILVIWQSKIMSVRIKLHAEEYGLLYALITGIQKIRLSGSERRAFAKWAEHYSQDAKLEYNPPLFLKLANVFHPAVLLAGTFVIYWKALSANISPEAYMAFTASYGLLTGAFTALCDAAVSMAMIGPVADMIRPVLEEVPEVSQGRALSKVKGGIEIANVSFKYSEKSPLVLNKISFKVRPGEYVAIVGKSGCGKSTLMRLLLGFDKPEGGVIYYDNADLKTLNLRSLRRNIGCVMQNSSLFPGSIYSNITISAPYLDEAAAWEAAEMAGIADDIKRMPMKMNTMISEGAGTISGGQRQRIIIARAIAPKPKILLFDEATSALDNITQKIVSESLDKLKCTRIVIAHRLSTVKNCERILVLSDGKIAEEGTYNELMNRKGLFASLVERQQTGGQI